MTYVILTCPEDEIAAEYKFFLQMLQVFAIQIAPADGKLLLLVHHIMGKFLNSGVGLLLLLLWSTLFICIIVLTVLPQTGFWATLAFFGIFWGLKTLRSLVLGYKKAQIWRHLWALSSAAVVVCSVLKTKISVKNAFFLNYALVLKKGSKIRIGNVKMNIGYN